MNDTPVSRFPELGFYGLPGHTRSPRDVLRQVQDAEELGIGNVMISERADYKEIAAICGACAAVTEKIFIGTSGTNLNTRHPVITASMCSTLSRLSEGRFALGLAKGPSMRWKAMNLPIPTFERERDFLDLLRRLLKGEAVTGYDGALGQIPAMSLAPYVDEDVPMLYIGFGPKSLEHAGTIYDGAHLHTFMTDEALSNAVRQFRAGEAAAGREVGRGKLWSVFATACDVPEEKYLRYIVARLATYLQIPGYGDMLVEINGWDPETLQRFRTSDAVRSVGGLIDSVATTAQMAEVAKVIPEEWRPAAVGDAATCARRWVDQFEAGADGLIIHASPPDEFEPVLREYEKIRPSHLFEGRTNRPGA
ncbi:MAG: TIGR03857 family LLM class F420-dependent oxidoreductase [Pseudomonadales bacterium]|nr:TIGR03857 family LLM class F420-dependent oxidoreductase [Pseudomonadales bacterium]